MSGRGESAALRRGRRTCAPVRALAVLILLPALLVLTAVAASGCGGSDPQLAALSGDWQRVVGGAPDPAHTLVVERSSDGVTLRFADSSGFQAQGMARLEGDTLVMEMPADNGLFDGATSLQVSLDAGGQLIVDRVLDDGTTEPVWVYDRASAP